MSTKKQIRKQRQQQRKNARGKVNPATVFVAFVVVALVVIGLVAYFVGTPPAPPWPGAVWSAQHGHWH